MTPYADSNFFTKLYLALPGTEVAKAWLAEARREAAPPLPVTWLHRLEIVNALEQQVFSSRLYAQPRITSQQAAAAQANFRDDLRRTDFFPVTHLLENELTQGFEELSLRHTARHGFRAYGVIHVASALLLGCDTFWSFDAKACRLAVLEGLKLGKR